MSNQSLSSLINVPHFTEEIRTYLFEEAKKRDYTYARAIPVDVVMETLDIQSGLVKKEKKTKEEIELCLSYILDSGCDTPLFRSKVVSKILESLDINHIYLENPFKNKQMTFDNHINQNIFEGEDLKFEKDTHLSITPSFKRCFEEYNRTKDLMYLFIFCMNIYYLQIFIKKNLSYANFCSEILSLKELERNMTLTI